MYNPKSLLITGANAGIGFEFAKQMAKEPYVERIVLGCRSQSKAEEAKAALEKEGNGSTKFEILLMDMLDLDSVRDAAKKLTESVEALVMNAGGLFGTKFADKTKYGTTVICTANLLGHVALYDELMQSGKLTKAVLYSGSEVARGNPPLLPAFKMPIGAVDAFKGICTGEYFTKTDALTHYGGVKYMAALWMTHEAAQHSEMRFVTVSPGATSGTKVYDTMPSIIKFIMTWIYNPVTTKLGMSHGVEAGARRYIDVLTKDEEYKSGKFYASANGLVGKLGDQAELFNPDFDDRNQAANANVAIRSFLA